MKRIILVTLMVIVCVAISTSAFALITLGGASATTTVFGGGAYKPSTNVTLLAGTSGTPANLYCATAVHSGAINNNAGRQYGTTSNSPQIMWGLAPSSGSAPDTCTPSGPTLPAAITNN